MFGVSTINQQSKAKWQKRLNILVLFWCRNPYDVACLAPYKGPIEPGIALGGYSKPEHGKSVNYKMAKGLTLTYLINNSKNKTALIPALEWELKYVDMELVLC